MEIICSNCGSVIRPPPGITSIRCAKCETLTIVSRSMPTLRGQVSPRDQAHSHGQKRAVICAVSYLGARYALKGCINDANCMKYFLLYRFNFPESSILMLSEEESCPSKQPTKSNMRAAMRWLVEGSESGDSLVFYYSGHGSQQRSYTGDEIDGYDETLCPLDFEKQGMIVDDELNATMVNPLREGVRLHAIIDACHSGTILDLPFLCRMKRSANGTYAWEDHRPRSGVWKGTSGGHVVSISGCDDCQSSTDTTALARIASTGAMTYAFIKAIDLEEKRTYGDIMSSMYATIRGARRDSNRTMSLLRMLWNRKMITFMPVQEPQLTSNEMFDIYEKPFLL